MPHGLWSSCPTRSLSRVGLFLILLLAARPPLFAQKKAEQNDSPGEAKERTAFRVTAWNVKNFRTAPGEAGTPPKPGNEIAAVIRCLTEIKPDVLGLVEMGSREDLALLQKQLNAGGVNLPESEWLEGADPDRHLAVLSRFPILRTTSHPGLTYLLDETRHPMQRGILDVTLAVTPDYQFRLLGAHLKSQRGTAAADEEMMRRNEARLLRKTLDRILGEEPEANLLLFGDFNCTRDNAAMRDIRGLAGSPGGLSLVTASDRWGHRWTSRRPPSSC